jgi:hypothetical protein
MFIYTPDKSVIGLGGRVLHFSVDRFIKDICEGDCCFICGISPSETEFNDEHVIPDWILKKYGLYTKTIRLPNGSTIRYDQYKVPCCKQCNGLLGEVFEHPISSLISQGYGSVTQYLKNNGPWLFFNWLALIFIKTHLKDKSLKLHRDSRKGNERIADLYAWEELHHIHCVARSFYTGCEIDSRVLGSFFVLPAETDKYIENFDYGDQYAAQSILLRLGDIAFISVLNDSRTTFNILRDDFEKISAPLSPIQLREFMIRCAFINLNLKERPRFYSEFDPGRAYHRIAANVPNELDWNEGDLSQYGAMLYSACEDLLSIYQNDNIEEVKELVKQGRITFLFDENGNFKTDSLVFKKKNLADERET